MGEVGVDQSKAAFAVKQHPPVVAQPQADALPNPTRLLITADGGGSNGSRARSAGPCGKRTWTANPCGIRFSAAIVPPIASTLRNEPV